MTIHIPRIAVYPGTFDPVTFGHLDIIARATSITDRLIVAVAENTPKAPLFSLDERCEIMLEEIASLPEPISSVIEVRKLHGLLAYFADECGASMIIRGLRAVSDFEYEFQMSSMNAKVAPHIQTVFLPASDRMQYVASRFVKDFARLDGDCSQFVSENVAARMKDKFGAF